MKKTVGKGIIYYLFLLISVVLGVGCVISAIMVLSPGTEILGLCYFVDKNSITITDVNNQPIKNLIAQGKVKSLNVNTNYASFKIETVKGSNGIRIMLDTEVSGLLKAENKVTTTMEYGYDVATESLIVNTKLPDMFLPFEKYAQVRVIIPETLTTLNFDVNFTTKSGSILIGTGKIDNYSIKNLNITSENGSNVNLGKYAKISGDINIDSPKGEVYIESALNATNLYIKSSSAKIQAGNLNVASVKLRTESSSVKLGNVNGDLIYDARKGVLIAEGIKGDFSCSESVIISNITIGTALGQVLLPGAESSNIKISTLRGFATIRTTSGNVTIGDTRAPVDISTQGGTIDVVINTDAELVQQYGKSKSINLMTTSGKIIAKFANIYGTNNIQTESGSVDINLDKRLNLQIQYTCTRNAPEVSSGITTEEVQKQGTITVGSASTNKIVLVNEKGKTTIKDSFSLEN